MNEETSEIATDKSIYKERQTSLGPFSRNLRGSARTAGYMHDKQLWLKLRRLSTNNKKKSISFFTRKKRTELMRKRRSASAPSSPTIFNGSADTEE